MRFNDSTKFRAYVKNLVANSCRNYCFHIQVHDLDSLNDRMRVWVLNHYPIQVELHQSKSDLYSQGAHHALCQISHV